MGPRKQATRRNCEREAARHDRSCSVIIPTMDLALRCVRDAHDRNCCRGRSKDRGRAKGPARSALLLQASGFCKGQLQVSKRAGGGRSAGWWLVSGCRGCMPGCTYRPGQPSSSRLAPGLCLCRKGGHRQIGKVGAGCRRRIRPAALRQSALALPEPAVCLADRVQADDDDAHHHARTTRFWFRWVELDLRLVWPGQDTEARRAGGQRAEGQRGQWDHFSFQMVPVRQADRHAGSIPW